MNEFIAKKLGGLLSLTNATLENYSEIKDDIKNILSTELIEEFKNNLKMQKDSIHTLADRAHLLPSVFNSLEKTDDKIKNIKKSFLYDSEDVFGRLNFLISFEGSAIAEWNLILSTAKSVGHEELIAISIQAIEIHEKIFENLNEAIKKLAVEYSRN